MENCYHPWQRRSRGQVVSIPRCCFVSLRGNGVQDHSLLTVFEWLDPAAGKLGFAGAVSCWLSRLAPPCHAAVCDAFMVHLLRKAGALLHCPAPTGPAGSEQRHEDTAAKAAGHGKVQMLLAVYSYLFIPPPFP